MAEGWISIHRKIQECDLWLDDAPFDRRSAWIDLLLLANHKDKEALFDGRMIVVEKGQRITSIRYLAERWHWSRHKVSDYLDLLEKAKMITQKRDTRKTVISIVNYGIYQDMSEEKEPLKSHQRATKEPPKDTNNNIYIDSKESIYIDMTKKKKAFVKPTIEEVKAYCLERMNKVSADAFFNYYESNGWKVGKNSMKDWKAAVRTWEHNDYGSKLKEQKAVNKFGAFQNDTRNDLDAIARRLTAN